MSRDSIEYKLAWNILIDSFREIVESEDFDDNDIFNNAMELIDDLADESLSNLVRERTTVNIQNYPPLDILIEMNQREVARAVLDIKQHDLFKYFNEQFLVGEREEIDEDDIINIIRESKKILDADLYIKDVPVLPTNEFTKDDILKYVELYKNNKVPLLYKIVEDPDITPFNFEDVDKEPPTDEDEPPTDGRLPLFKTQKDFLPLNLFQDPKELNKQLKDQLQQKNFSEYAKAGHIDVPYLIGTDNINRLYNNNKLQAELRNGTLNNRDRIKQWHKDKRLALLNKYDTYKEPIKIRHPFNN